MDVDSLAYITKHFFHHCRTSSPEGFQDWALAELHKLILFDAAIWVSGTIDPVQTNIHRTHCYNFPEKDLQQFKNHFTTNMPALLQASNNCGLTLDFLNPTNSLTNDHKEMLQTCLEQPIFKHAIISVHHKDSSGLFYSLILYRTALPCPFSEHEKSILSFAVLLLQEGKLINLTSGITRANNRFGEGIAICDQHGFIRDADPAFNVLIKIEHPDWDSLRLDFIPTDLLQSKEPTHFIGTSIIIDFTASNGFILLRARSVKSFDSLTPAEKNVARHLIQGQTNKEIGRNLKISPKTVSNHLHHIFVKTEARNRQHAVAIFTNA